MISIIVPIYKVEKYIRECVDSIIAQSYSDIEIVLVNDGSPDNCPAICDEYAIADSRVKVVHKENGGLMSARQAGLRASTGEYIGFVDGDDSIEPDMYERFANAIERYKPDIALCEFYYDYPNKLEKSNQNLIKPYFTKTEIEAEIYPTMLFKNTYYQFGINPCCWSKVFKRELLEKVLYNVTPKVKIGEDAAFSYPCLLEANSLAYIDKCLYHYRINQESMTKKYDKNFDDIILIPYNILKEAFSRYNYDFSSQINYYLLYLVNGVIRNEASAENKKSVKEKLATFKKFTSNEDVVDAAKSVDYSLLPFHTKLVAKFFSMKSPTLLYLYSVMLRRFL